MALFSSHFAEAADKEPEVVQDVELKPKHFT